MSSRLLAYLWTEQTLKFHSLTPPFVSTKASRVATVYERHSAALDSRLSSLLTVNH
jgi:hypothetical protein